MGRAAAIVIVLTAVAVAVALGSALRDRGERARCGAGFVARGARCAIADPGRCPRPLVSASGRCDAPDLRVLVPAGSLAIGPSDWEAEGRVAARSIHVEAFRVDAFEVTRGRWQTRAHADADALDDGEAARAASGMTRREAEAFCAASGGRLPTEDEWMVAAASAADPPRRYPWGDTGAVCRRAAWGLLRGPCALAADGPDLVGAHEAGDSPLGLHDMAGNVAEWVSGDAAGLGAGGARMGIAKGGSWQTELAAELRIWARLELDPGARDARVGLRCAYSP